MRSCGRYVYLKRLREFRFAFIMLLSSEDPGVKDEVIPLRVMMKQGSFLEWQELRGFEGATRMSREVPWGARQPGLRVK